MPAQPVMQDQDSHYTYAEEMGETPEMPKIAVRGLRQTAPTSKLQNKITAKEERDGYQQPFQHPQQQYTPQEKRFIKPKPITPRQGYQSPQAESSQVKLYKALKRPSQLHPAQPVEPPEDNQYWEATNNMGANDQNEESIHAGERQSEAREESERQSQRQSQRESHRESQRPSQRPSQKQSQRQALNQSQLKMGAA